VGFRCRSSRGCYGSLKIGNNGPPKRPRPSG
jgi:hypothetical protein